MANPASRLLRATTKCELWRRGFASEAGAFSLTFASPTKVC